MICFSSLVFFVFRFSSALSLLLWAPRRQRFHMRSVAACLGSHETRNGSVCTAVCTGLRHVSPILPEKSERGNGCCAGPESRAKERMAASTSFGRQICLMCFRTLSAFFMGSHTAHTIVTHGAHRTPNGEQKKSRVLHRSRCVCAEWICPPVRSVVHLRLLFLC